MPRDGALTLSDVRDPALSIVCEPCGRRETYDVARLMERHGDAKLTDLLQTLANCPKARSVSIHDRCRAVFERLSLWPSAFRTVHGLDCLGRRDCEAKHAPHAHTHALFRGKRQSFLGARLRSVTEAFAGGKRIAGSPFLEGRFNARFRHRLAGPTPLPAWPNSTEEANSRTCRRRSGYSRHCRSSG